MFSSDEVRRRVLTALSAIATAQQLPSPLLSSLGLHFHQEVTRTSKEKIRSSILWLNTYPFLVWRSIGKNFFEIFHIYCFLHFLASPIKNTTLQINSGKVKIWIDGFPDNIHYYADLNSWFLAFFWKGNVKSFCCCCDLLMRIMLICKLLNFCYIASDFSV